MTHRRPMNRPLALAAFAVAVFLFAGSAGTALAAGPSSYDEFLHGGYLINGEGSYPNGVVLDGAGDVYVVESDGSTFDRVVRLQPDGSRIETWGSTGSGDGQILWPVGVDVDASGDLYVVDMGNSRVVKFGADGPYDQFVDFGSVGSAGSELGQFSTPWDVAVDGLGNFFVSDQGNNRIQAFDSNGTPIYGLTWDDNGFGALSGPSDIHVDPAHLAVYVADTGNGRVLRYDYVAGSFIAVRAFTTGLSSPIGVDVDKWGTVFVTDGANSVVERFAADGTHMREFGGYGSGDDQLASPMAISVDTSVNVYICEGGNDRVHRFDILPANDNAPPLTTSNIPSGWTHGDGTSFEVSLTATDASSTIAGTYYTTDGTTPTVECTYTTPFSITDEGTTTVKYHSVDTAENTETVKTQYLRFDSHDPTTSSDATAVYDGTAVIHLTAVDNLSGIAQTQYQIDTSGWNFGTTIQTSQVGTHTVYWQSSDAAGNIEDTRQFTFYVNAPDDDPPITTSNIPWSWLTVTTFTVSLDATDPISGVENTFYQLDGGAVETYTAQFPISTPGTTAVTFWSVDGLGNVETATTEYLRIDAVAPETTNDLQESYIGTMQVTLTASDAVSGVSVTRYQIDNGSWTTGTAVFFADQLGGQHELKWYSADIAGNSENIDSEFFQIIAPDYQPPVTEHDLGGAGWVPGPYLLWLSPYDDLSGVAYTKVSTDGTFPTRDYEGTITISAEGSHTIKFYSVDNQNNTETVQTYTLLVDSTPPSTTADIQPAYVESATVQFSRTDNLSGAIYTDWKVDSGGWNRSMTALVTGYGVHTLYWHSMDSAGNWEATQSAEVVIAAPDSEPPTSTTNVAPTWVRGPYSVAMTATDTSSTIKYIWYTMDNWANKYLYTTTFTVSAEQTTTLQYYAVDYWNNREATQTAYVKIDNTPPVSSSDMTGTPATYVDQAEIQLTAADWGAANTRTFWKVDGGSYREGTLATNAVIGFHTLYWYSADSLCNTETPAKSRAFRIRARDQLVEQDDTRVVLKKSWTTASGGSNGYAYSSDATAQIHVEINGTRLRWYGPKGPDYGIAQVYFDGVATGTVDLYASSYSQYNILFDSDILDYRAHHLRVDWTGTKNEESSGTRIGADYFYVEGNILTVPDSVPPVTVSNAPGSWQTTNVVVSLASDDETTGVYTTYARAAATPSDPTTAHVYSAPMTITADGLTYLRYYSVDFRGNAETIRQDIIRIDKVAPNTTNNAAASYINSATVTLSPQFDTSGLSGTFWRLGSSAWTSGTVVTTSAPGIHTLQYYSVDQAGNTEATKSASFELRVRHEQGVPQLVYQGTWSPDNNAQHSNASASYVATTGGAVVAHFNGTGIDYIAPRYNNRGKARVILDGVVASAAVELYSPSVQYKQKVWGVSGLAAGRHSLVIEWTGLKHPSSSSSRIDVDALDVLGTLETVEDTVAPVSSSDATDTWSSVAETVTLSAMDAVTSVRNTYYRVGPGAVTTYTGPFLVSAEGTNAIEYWSVDTLGNVEATQNAIVRIDYTDPATSDDTTTTWLHGPVDVALTPADPLSGPAATYWRLNGSDVSTATGPVAVSDMGTNTLEYWSSDIAGNVEPTKTAHVFIDPVAPETSDDAPEGWSPGAVWVSLTASDALSGPALTTYSLDGADPEIYLGDVQVSGEGTHTLAYLSVDAVGNVEDTRTVDVRIDMTDPGTVATPSASYLNTATISFSASDTLSGVSETWWQLDGSESGTGTEMTTYVPLDHTLAYRSTDWAGNVEDTRNAMFRVVNRHEEKASLLATSGTWAYGTSGFYSASAYGQSSAVGAAYHVAFDGTSIDWITNIGSTYGIARLTLDGNAPIEVDLYGTGVKYKQVAWTSGKLPAGRHYVRIEVTGSRNASATNFRIPVDAFDVAGTLAPADKASPVTTHTAPAGWVASPATVTLTAEDATAGVAVTRYRIGSGEITTYTGPFGISDQGTTTVKYWSVDMAGNTEVTRTATVRVDDGAPVTTDNAPEGWAHTPLSVTLSRSDTYSGIATTTYLLDGGPESPYLGPISITGEGTHTLAYRSIDIVGNEESLSTVTVLVDDTAPETTHTAPAGWVHAPATVSLSAEDTASGVAAILYRVGSGDAATYTGSFEVSDQGTTTVSYWSVDVAGNTEVTKTATVRVDDVDPVTTDDAPEGWVPTPLSVTLFPTDACSGIATTTYLLDGGPESAYLGPIEITGEGTHTLAYRSIDLNGNEEAVTTVTLLVDNFAPETTHTAPSEWVHAPATVSLSAEDTASGVAATLYRIGSGDDTTYTGSFEISDQGTTTVSYWSVDVAGNTEVTRTVTVRVDDVDPVTADDAPEGWVHTPLSVTLTPTDAHSGVTTTTYVLDDGEVSLYSAPIPITGEGTHTLAYRSLDVVGNDEPTTTITLLVDNFAPETTHTAPSEWVHAPANVSLSAEDTASGVAARFYRVGSGDVTTYTEAFQISDQGTTTVSYWSVDVAGNTEATKTATVRVDDTDPVTTDDAPEGWAHSPVSVTLTGTDEHSGIAETVYVLDGVGPQLYGGPVWVSGEGTHTLSYRSTDLLGNEEATTTVSMFVDDFTPDTTAEAPAGWVGDSTEVTLTATDSQSGVAATYFRVNAGAATTYTEPVPVATPGTTTVAYWSVDVASNVETSTDVLVRIDGEVPTTTSNALASYTNTASITLTRAETLSGIAHTYWRIDGGDWNEGTTIQTTVPLDHTLDFYSVDIAGNVEPTRTAAFRVVNRYEQDHSSCATTGVWAYGTGASYSGMSYRQSAVLGSTFNIAFDGTSIDWITNKGSSYGIARLRLDDGEPFDIDLYSTGLKYKQVAWTSGSIPAGRHYLRIEVSGSKNASSTNFRIPVDAFDVAGVPADGDIVTPSTSHSAPTTWTRGPAVVTLTATDTQSGVAHTYYRIGSEATATYADHLDVTQQGTSTVTYWSVDAMGNTEATKALTVRVDDGEPLTTDDAPEGWSREPVSVSLTASDALSGVSNTMYALDSGDATAYAGAIDVSAQGTTTIDYWSFDIAGNREPTRTAIVRVDGGDPETTHTAPDDWTQSPAAVTLIPTDLHSGVTQTFYRVGAADVATYAGTFEVSEQGTTTVSYWSVDAAGNTEPTRTLSVRVDDGDPVTTDDATLTWRQGPVDVVLERSDALSGIGSTSYFLDDDPEQTYTGAIAVSGEGTHTLLYRTTDAVGNVEGTRSATILIDDTDPSTEHTAPTGWTSAPAIVTLSATDLPGGVAHTFYRVGSGDVTTYTTDISIDEQGSITVWYWSVDVAGNVEATNSVTVTVDDTPPTTTAHIPAGWASGSAEVSLTVTDGESGPGTTYYSLDGAPVETYADPVVVSGDGTHTLAYRSTDAAGNAEGTKTVDVFVDSIDPETTDNAPAGWAAGSFQLTLSGSDALSGLSGTYYTIDGGDPETYTAPFTITKPETTDIAYWSVDLAGNTEVTRTATVRLDNTIPTSTCNAVASYTNTASITLGRTDTLSGLAGTYWRLDGSEWTSGTSVFTTSPLNHTLDYYSTDEAGNVEPTRTANFRVVNRYEQGHSAVATTTGWNYGTSGSYSGGSYYLSAVIGSTLTFGFDGTSIDWITTKGNSYGIARLRIDGGAPFDVDLYSATLKYKQVAWASPELPDGPHVLRIEVSGSKNATSSNFRIPMDAFDIAGIPTQGDLTAPVTTHDAPSDWVTEPAPVTLTASDSAAGVAHTYYRIGAGENTTYTGQFAVSEQGTTTVSYWSVDLAGNTETTKTLSVRVDTQAPVTSDDAPDGWSTVPATVTLTPSEGGSGLTGTYYRIDSGAETPYAEPFVISAEGTSVVTYWSTDLAGNVETAGVATVRIDTDAPLTLDDAPAGWVSTPVTVTLTTTDGISGATGTYYSVDGGAPAEYTLPIGVSALGTTTISYWSTDAAGNVEESRTALVRIDNDLPTTTDNAPGGWASAGFPLTLTGQDAISAVQSTFYRVNDGEVATYLAPIPVTLPNTTTVAYWSVDLAGNREATKTASVRVDSTVPTTTSNAQAAYLNTATITLTRTDTISGLTGTYWSLDGSAWTSGTSIFTTAPLDHTLRFYSTDAAGNVEPTRTAEFRVHNRYEQGHSMVATTTGWNYGSSGSYSGGSYIMAVNAGASAGFAFEGTSIDWISTKGTSYGIARVSLDGGPPVEVDLYYPSLRYKQVAWTSGKLDAGHHYVRIQMTGSANASATSSRIVLDAFDIGGSPASGDVIAPTTTHSAESSWTQGPVQISLESTDTTSGVMHTFYRIGAGGVTTYTAPFSVSAEGTTVVSYWSTDHAGNTEATKTATVRVDDTPPSTSDDAPEGWVPAAYAMTLTSSDDLSGASSTYYRLNGSAPVLYAEPITFSAPNTNTVQYWSVDLAGNTESTQTATVRYDSTIPTTTDNAAASYMNTATVTLARTDTLSGISHTLWALDGGEATTGVSFTTTEPRDHTLSYRSVDVAGNTEESKTAEFRVVNRFEQTNSYVATSGTWTYGTSTNYTANSYGMSWTTSSTVRIAFVGTSIDWITVKGSSYGIARVTLDSEPATDVDLYSPSLRFKNAAYTSGTLPYGRHVLKVEVTGSRNTSSTNARIVHDAFDIAGVPTAQYYENDDPALAYTGSWNTGSGANYTGNTYALSGVPGSTLNVAFDGTYIDWTTVMGSSYGIARITLDSDPATDVDLYSSGVKYQQTVWSSGTLPFGRHYLKIEVTGSKNASSTHFRIANDMLTVMGNCQPTDVEAPVTTSNAKASYVGPATITLTAHDVGWGLDSTWWSLNGSAWTTGTVVTASDPGLYDLQFYSVDRFGNVETTKSASFKVVNRYEENNPLISRVGTWTTGSSSARSGNGYILGLGSETSVTISFTGTSIDWITTIGSTYGIVRISLDGGPAEEKDLYNSSVRYKQTVWSSGPVSDGYHTLTIGLTGTKRPAATNTRAECDAFDVAGTIAP